MNHLPASNDWSISRKGLVLFSAITFVVRCHRLPSRLPAPSSCLLIFFSDGVSFLLASPLSCSLTFSLSPHWPISLRGRCGAHRDWLVAHSGTHRVYGSGKATLSHFLLFCWKWAAGVSYLSRTEILLVRRWGVAAITSFTIISFRLINSKAFHFVL